MPLLDRMEAKTKNDSFLTSVRSAHLWCAQPKTPPPFLTSPLNESQFAVLAARSLKHLIRDDDYV